MPHGCSPSIAPRHAVTSCCAARPFTEAYLPYRIADPGVDRIDLLQLHPGSTGKRTVNSINSVNCGTLFPQVG